MILFKKQFKQKIIDWIKTTTYREKWIYYKKWDIVNTNFKENWEFIKIKILDIVKVDFPNYIEYQKDWFESIEEMKDYFKNYPYRIDFIYLEINS